MGSEPICRHQIIASANEVFSGVGLSRTSCLGGISANGPPLDCRLVSYRDYGSSLCRWPAEGRRMTVDRVLWTRHFDTVRAFFDVSPQVYEYQRMSDIGTPSGN